MPIRVSESAGFQYLVLILTYKRKTTVCAPANLGLVGVDEDPGVTERAASAVAGDNALVCPADGLLVNEIDSGVWARLYETGQQLSPYSLEPCDLLPGAPDPAFAFNCTPRGPIDLHNVPGPQ